MPETNDNLKKAFAGESQAYQKYKAFAKRAEKDGFPNIARLFRTTAEAEKIHAEGHLAALDAVGSTADNIKAAIEGETHEFKEMYPPMLAQAEAEGSKARRMFGFAVKAEEVHAALYALALEAAEKGKDLPDGEFYLCPVCGHVEPGKPPEACPICGVKGARYVLADA
ncbi:Rubrerythrin-2 [Planctomycetaceae bacterium]|nr:Rubrerythrin-2 [Planctomycetaceae bacterium]